MTTTVVPTWPTGGDDDDNDGENDDDNDDDNDDTYIIKTGKAED